MTIILEQYLARIEYRQELKPTLITLESLHLAHVTHIPFENLDVLLRRPIKLDPQSLWAKLITGGRGGYCFEQNAVFAAVLEEIGFRVTRLAARVRMNALRPRPRTHMLLGVTIDDQLLLADVGFGSAGLLHPIALRVDEVAEHFGWKYRVVEDGMLKVLQLHQPGGWLDLYAFTLEEQQPVDYEMASYYTSTHPHSSFVHTLLVQRPGIESRLMLLNRRLIEFRHNRRTESAVPDDDALLEVLDTRFGLKFPSGTRFNYDDSMVPPA
jgi:N-hydroxyarylamine O-acetyltransferase